MAIICVIDGVALCVLIWIALRQGLEKALPFAAFVFVLTPRDASIPLPGLFDLTTQRLVLLTMVGLYCFLPSRGSSAGRIYRPLRWLIAVHIIWCLISTANSVVPLMSIKKMVSESIEYYVLYYVFVRVVTNRGTINRILFAIVAAVIVCSALGAVEAYNNWAVIDWFPRVTHHFDGWSVQVEFSGRGQRVATTFAHPILFGAGLVMAIVLTLYLLKVTSGIGKKALLWGGLLLMFLNIYKTSSRGPWLGLILSFAALFIWEKGRGRRYLTMIGILSMTVLLIRPGIWETLGNMYVGTLDPNSPLGSSYEYRYALRDLAVKTVSKSAERALWGYGMESFYYLGLEADLNGKPYKFLSCDSAWVELMVETGYVGLLIVGAILLVPPWFAWNSLRRSPHSGDRVQLYLMTIMLAYYFMMLSAAMYGWGQTGYILWMIIAASTVHNRLQIARAPGTKAKPMEIEDEAPLARLAPSLNCGG